MHKQEAPGVSYVQGWMRPTTGLGVVAQGKIYREMYLGFGCTDKANPTVSQGKWACTIHWPDVPGKLCLRVVQNVS